MWLEHTKSGKVQFREYYIDPLTDKKKTVSVTYNKHTRKTEQEALIMLQKKIEKKIKEATNRVPSAENMTFKELVDQWLEEYKTIYKEGTIKNRKDTTNIICKRFGTLLLKNLNVSMFNNYLLELKQSGLKENTVKSYHSALNLVLKFGKSYGFITDKNLLDGLKLPKYNQTKTDKDVSYLEREELAKVIEQLEKSEYHEIARLCLIQTHTGLRIGELVGIDYDRQIDFGNSSIVIDRAYSSKTNKFDLPKTNAIRTIYFNEDTKKLLLEQIQYTKIKTLEKGFTKDPILFKNGQDKPLQHSTINKILSRVVNIDRQISTHIFRHTFIAYMIEQGTPMELIAKHVGHSTTNTIQKFYYHFTEKMDNELQKEIGKMEI